MIIRFEVFEEYRILDNVKIIGSGFTYNVDNEYDENDFLNYITFNIRENGEKLRYKIDWNHKYSHNLIEKLKGRTSIKNTLEFKNFTKKFLNELFNEYYDSRINAGGDYSLWLSEYNLSFIININHKNKKIYVVTLINGIVSNNVIDVIELKSVL